MSPFLEISSFDRLFVWESSEVFKIVPFVVLVVPFDLKKIFDMLYVLKNKYHQTLVLYLYANDY